MNNYNYIPSNSLFKINLNTTVKTKIVVPKNTIPSVKPHSTIKQTLPDSSKKANINVKSWSIKIK